MPRLLTLFVVALALCVVSASAYNNGVGRTPALGWNTWCTNGICGEDLCNENEIHEIADAMVANGMLSLGYNYINMDDCWGGPRNKNGSYQPDPERFPSGMFALADYVHSKGFKLGVYTDAGLSTCNPALRPWITPGSYGHYAGDAATFAAWGVDYVKMDWCNHVLPNGTALDPRVVYAEMSVGLNETGRTIWYNLCEGGEDQPWTGWGANISQSWRAASDHKDKWSSTASTIQAMVGKGKYTGPYGWNDFDFLMTGGQECPIPSHDKCPGQTDVEYQTEYTMWTIAASPIIVATDVRRLTPIMEFVLFNPEVIAVHQDPLGSGGDRVGFIVGCGGADNNQTACEIWARDLSTGGRAIALYNSGDTEAPFSFTISDFFPDYSKSTLQVRNLWERLNVGTFNGTQTFPSGIIPKHGTMLYSFTPSN